MTNLNVDVVAPSAVTATLLSTTQSSYRTIAVPDILGASNTHNLSKGESADLTSLLPAGSTPAAFIASLKAIYAEWGGLSITSNPNTTNSSDRTYYSLATPLTLGSSFSMDHQGANYVKGENYNFSSPDGSKLLLNDTGGFYSANTDVYAFTGGGISKAYDIGNVRLLYQVQTSNPDSMPTISASYDGTHSSVGDTVQLYEGSTLLGGKVLGVGDIGSSSESVNVQVAHSLSAGTHVITTKYVDLAGNTVVGNDVTVNLAAGASAPVLSNLQVTGKDGVVSDINASSTSYAMVSEQGGVSVGTDGLSQNLTFSGTVGSAASGDRYLVTVSMGGQVLAFDTFAPGNFSMTTSANVLAPGLYKDLSITATDISDGVNNGQTASIQNQTLGWYWTAQSLGNTSGGAGNDVIPLGATANGANTLIQTGLGNDTLVLGVFGATNPGKLAATVTDFTVGQDKIAVFGQTVTAGNLSQYVTASAANNVTTKLVVDLNGPAAGGQVYTLYLQNVAYKPDTVHTLFGV
ncbi:hypothetical protein [Herbaspirillum sp. NPDC087042]|uniref:hypothetical protein n=1 Tax=Herbaspirillum sp. NPDC087042 TaxID=3364004 RepID=UPI0038233B97